MDSGHKKEIANKGSHDKFPTIILASLAQNYPKKKGSK